MPTGTTTVREVLGGTAGGLAESTGARCRGYPMHTIASDVEALVDAPLEERVSLRSHRPTVVLLNYVKTNIRHLLWRGAEAVLHGGSVWKPLNKQFKRPLCLRGTVGICGW